MAELLRADPAILTWWGAPVECVSVLARLARLGELTGTALAQAHARLAMLRAGWTEVVPNELLRTQAERVLRLHPLRAADALQLAAAIIASDFRPTNLAFVSLDQRLVTAAAREGFQVESVGGPL